MFIALNDLLILAIFALLGFLTLLCATVFAIQELYRYWRENRQDLEEIRLWHQRHKLEAQVAQEAEHFREHLERCFNLD